MNPRICTVVLLALAFALPICCKPLQGVSTVGVGFDIYTGKTRLPVIDQTYSQQRVVYNPYTNVNDSVPDQVFASAQSSVNFVTVAFENVAEVAQAAAAAYVNAYGATNYTEYAFVGSEQVSQASSLFSAASTVVVQATAEFSLWNVIVLPSSSLTQHFESEVAALPEKYDEKAYKKFVQTYGTHYVVEATLGGAAAMYATAVITADAESAAVALANSASYQLANATGVYTVQAISTSSNTAGSVASQAQTQTQIALVGGVVESAGDAKLTYWVSSIKNAPTKINYRLSEITELVDNPEKQRHLKTAITKHILASHQANKRINKKL